MSEEGGHVLEAVAQMQACAQNFVLSLVEGLPGVSAGEMSGIALAAYAPFEIYVLR